PASGIALAFVLRYGYRICLGVLLGSFLVNIGNAFDEKAVIHSIVMALLIGVGASLQAFCGAYLTKRYTKSLELIGFKDIGKFLLFGGLISSLISPSIGIMTLFVNQLIGVNSVVSSWATWWIGDALGIILVTPLTFLWIGEPREVWKSRRYYLIIPLLINLAIIITILNFGYKTQERELKNSFEKKVHDFRIALEYRIKEFYVTLDSLYGFYASSVFVDRNEFHEYTSNILPNMQHIKSIAWSPRVPRKERERFVESVRAEGLDSYFIKQVSPEGKITKEAEREEYFPLLYIEPFYENRQALGVDNGSEMMRDGALELALETGKYGASAPVTLIQDRGTNKKSIIWVKTVYKKHNPQIAQEGGNDHLEGFITLTTRVEDVIQKAYLNSSPMEDVYFKIFDQTTNTEQIVFSHNQEKEFSEKFHEEFTLDIAGRQWRFFFAPTIGFFEALQNWTLWFIITGAFFLATLLNVLLLIVTGQNIEVKRTVDARTKELEWEIKNHKETTVVLASRGSELDDARIAALNIMEDALEAQTKAEEAEKRARQASSVKSEFTSMVSHELRTPLTVIKESVAIVFDGTAGPISDDQKEFLNTAKRNVDRLARLINDVLDYQKLEAQQMEFRMTEEDINEVVRESGESFVTSLKNKGIGLDMKLAPDLPKLTLDKDKITQVIVNLINNAMKFTEEGRIVLMTERLGNNAIKVSVKDSGIGIKEEDLDKLFKHFSQIS
ncbi:MAG: CHASE domain-containing protein, partial [Candidatus Omnitrophica bacterium]|nr:CHASE domain-containing protein [Candidatus Omnitrophota bacterium]